MTRVSVSELLQQFVTDTEGESVSLGDLLDVLENRSFGPLLLGPALIALSPVGAIPGMSVITGTWIILVSVQIFFTPHPWLPRFLRSISFSRDRLKQSVSRIQPWVKWLEKGIRARYVFLTKPPANYVIALISILLALTFFPLALVPGGVALPSAAITLLALALTASDGLLAGLGYSLTVAVIALLTIVLL